VAICCDLVTAPYAVSRISPVSYSLTTAYEIAALVTVLERNGLPRQTAVREEITRPTAKTGTRREMR
jgi:hypothetical protein